MLCNVGKCDTIELLFCWSLTKVRTLDDFKGYILSQLFFEVVTSDGVVLVPCTPVLYSEFDVFCCVQHSLLLCCMPMEALCQLHVRMLICSPLVFVLRFLLPKQTQEVSRFNARLLLKVMQGCTVAKQEIISAQTLLTFLSLFKVRAILSGCQLALRLVQQCLPVTIFSFPLCCCFNKIFGRSRQMNTSTLYMYIPLVGPLNLYALCVETTSLQCTLFVVCDGLFVQHPLALLAHVMAIHYSQFVLVTA